MIDADIRNMLTEAKSIGIISHKRPDGDAVGSVLGLGLALLARKKQVQMVLKDGLSQTFRHLAGSELIKHDFSGDCDTYIVVDSSDLLRTGNMIKEDQVDLVVDHHVTNEGFGKLNLVEPDSVATCAILAEHMPSWDLEINVEVASALLTGILSDSIGFRTSNTTAASLRIAADLMDKGADIGELYNKALVSRSFEATNYWGFALGRLERDNGLVWTSLSLEDRKNSKYPGNDDADLTNIISSIDDLDIAILFIEQNHGLVKISWRSRPGVDVSQLASSFGGGGHQAAAGAEIMGSMQEVKENVLFATKTYLENLVVEATKPPRGR